MSSSVNLMVDIKKSGISDDYVFMSIYRNISHINASVDLLYLGYYAESCSILRNAYEMTTMLACILSNPNSLEEWKKATKTDYMRGGKFSPAKLRDKSSAILKLDQKTETKRYRTLCEVATHPDNNGIFFFNHPGDTDHIWKNNNFDCEFILEEIAYQSYLLTKALMIGCKNQHHENKILKDSTEMMSIIYQLRKEKNEKFGIPFTC